MGTFEYSSIAWRIDLILKMVELACTLVPGPVLPMFKSKFAAVREIRLEEHVPDFFAGPARIRSQ